MKYIAIAALVLCTGCVSALRLPGTKDPTTEQIRLLTHAIEKQSDAIVAISTAKPSPSPSPSPTPEESKNPVIDSFGERPASMIAVKRSK